MINCINCSAKRGAFKYCVACSPGASLWGGARLALYAVPGNALRSVPKILL